MIQITLARRRVVKIAFLLIASVLPISTARAQPALLDMPVRVAVDSHSNVFVIEATARRIAKFDSTGTLVTRFGGSGTLPGQFLSVQDIAIDAADNVLVLDRTAKAAIRFTNLGFFKDAWPLFPPASPVRPDSLVVDAGGRLFVSDDGGGVVYVFSSTGQFITGLPVITGQPGVDTPGDLALDGSGNLYAVDRANHRVLKFGTSGPANNPLTWLGWIGGCTGGSRCQAVPGAGGPPSRTTGWCTDLSQCGDPLRGTGKGRFDNPIFVSAAANGAINVSDVGSGAIQRFDPSGAYVGDLAIRGRSPGQTGGGDATAVGANGDIYAVQTLIGRVSQFTASGTFKAVFGGGVELSVFPGDTILNPLRYTVPGTSASTIGVISIGGYTGPLSLAATRCIGPQGLPPKLCSALGITTSFSSSAVTVTSGGAATTLQVTVSPATPDGLSLVIVDSTTAGVPAFAQVAADVKLQRAVTVVPTPTAITIMPGDLKKPVDIAVTSVNVSGQSTLSAAFTPPPAAGQMSFGFTPDSGFPLVLNGKVNRTLEVTASPVARTANYTLNVTANAPNGVKATSPVAVTVACNCTTTGDFVLPSVRPVTATSGLTGTSPDGTFVVTASSVGLSASVAVAAQSAPAVSLVGPIGNASSWGFSPDSRFFLVTSAGPSPNITMLDIYDLTFQNRRVVFEQITACPVSDPTCLPPSSFCYAGAGNPPNNACTGGGGATKTSSFTVSNAAWGFGPDSKSFMIASVNPLVSSNQYQLTLYNLAAGSPLAPVIVSTTGPTISSFWQFSPCGDLFMHFQQLFPMPSSNDVADFYRTANTTQGSASERAYLIVAANGTVASGPVGARIDPAFFSNGDFDVRLLNLSRASGSPATGFQSPQCQRR